MSFGRLRFKSDAFEGVIVETLQEAHDLMEQLISSHVAPIVFGLALLLTSLLSTFTGTLSGQVVLQVNQISELCVEASLQGFLNMEMSPWLHRLLTRSVAILPAAALQTLYGDKGAYKCF